MTGWFRLTDQGGRITNKEINRAISSYLKIKVVYRIVNAL